MHSVRAQAGGCAKIVSHWVWYPTSRTSVVRKLRHAEVLQKMEFPGPGVKTHVQHATVLPSSLWYDFVTSETQSGDQNTTPERAL